METKPSFGMGPQPNKNNKKLDKVVVGLSIFLVLIVGLSIFLYMDRNDKVAVIEQRDQTIITNQQEFDSTKNALQMELTQAVNKLDSLQNKNKDLQADLSYTNRKLNASKIYIEKLLSKDKLNQKELMTAKFAVEEMTKNVTILNAQIAKLKQDDSNLTVINQQLLQTNDSLQQALDASVKERDKLELIVSALQASGIKIDPVDVASKQIVAGGKADGIKVSFRLDGTKYSPSGQRFIYVILTGPDNKIINGDPNNVFMLSDSTQKQYSNLIKIDYVQGRGASVNYIVKLKNPFVAGKYNIEVYNNGIKIGGANIVAGGATSGGRRR
ncbi:MAG: hypothetical protein QM535_15220 [Limnohabitans sp.]|nr:hypothetical protein [Limnohabitans sp.]